MFNISSYLEKFKNIGQDKKLLKETICLTVKEITGVEIEIKNIIIKNGEIIFNVSPAIKNLLFIKKRLILFKIKQKGISENINELR